MVAAAVTHPLDLAKVRMQTAHIRGDTMIGTLKRVIRNEGFFAIYRGLSASLLRQATYSTTRFGVYEYLKEQVRKSPDDTPPFHVLLPLSMIAGCVGGIVGNPADVVNIRMQNDRALPIEKQRHYKNAFDGIRRIVTEESFSTLFRGLVPNCTRGVLMTASQVVSYDMFKSVLVHKLNMSPDTKTTHFSASLLAGLVATTVCSPADVVKTRIMHSHGASDGGAIQILRDAIRSEGILFAFRGWVPAFVRLGPHTIVTFIVMEQLREWGIGQHNHHSPVTSKAS